MEGQVKERRQQQVRFHDPIVVSTIPPSNPNSRSESPSSEQDISTIHSLQPQRNDGKDILRS